MNEVPQKSADEIRKEVSEAYTRAIQNPSVSGCCGGGCGAPADPTPKGVTAKAAGYAADELAALPADAVENSFGCGNPLAFGEVLPGQTVLDLGSGAGIDLLLAARKVCPTGKVIGVDMTDEMIARARANIAAAGAANVEVRKGFIEELPVEDGSVDWVISNCVINLSPDKPRVFREIARVLAPGGRFSISDIVAEEIPEQIRKSAALYSACVAGAISERKYLEGLRAAGLEDVRVTDRIVYERSQIEAFLHSETLPGLGKVSEEVLSRLAEAAAGKIWSAKVVGRKP